MLYTLRKRLFQNLVILIISSVLLAFYAHSEDEIVAPEFITGDFYNDPTVTIAYGQNPQPSCVALRARAGRSACPLTIEPAAVNQWRCSALHPSDTGACFDPEWFTNIVGYPTYVASCPASYKLVNPKATNTFFGGRATVVNGIPVNVTHANTYEDSYCARCIAPFTWNNETSKCETQCPVNSNFNSDIGECVSSSYKKPIEHCEEIDGNPVNAGTGEKVQYEEPDYIGSGDFPLVFQRIYKSYMSPTVRPKNGITRGVSDFKTIYQPSSYHITKPQSNFTQTVDTTTMGGAFVNNWSHSYNKQLFVMNEIGNERIVLVREDGKKLRFADYGVSPLSTPTELDGRLFKIEEPTADAFYEFYPNDGTVEIYSSDGRLNTIKDSQGFTQKLSYENDKLVSITDHRGRVLTLTYNDEGLLGGLIQPDGNEVQYEYNAGYGKLTGVNFPTSKDVAENAYSVYYSYENESFPFALTGKTDSSGNTLGAWEYDSSGRVIKSTHASDIGKTEFKYFSSSTIVSKENGYEKILNYSDGQLQSVIGATCDSNGVHGEKSFLYNSFGLPYIFHENGREDESSYTKSGLQTFLRKGYDQPSSEWQWARTTWHAKFAIPLSTSINYDLSYKFEYTDEGKLLNKTKAANSINRITSYTYNESGLLASIDGPREDVNDIISYEYYANGDLYKVTDALGHSTTYLEYNLNGHPTQIQDPNGNIAEIVYSTRGQVLSIKLGDLEQIYQYSPKGDLVYSNDGKTEFFYEYDEDFRLASVENSRGEKQLFEYDQYGNLILQGTQDQNNNLLLQVVQSFDAYGRLTSKLDPLGNETRYEYDIANNKVMSDTADIQVVRHEYDVFNRIVKTIDPLLGEVNMSYNQMNNITGVTDQNGNATAYDWNGFGEMTRVTSQDTGSKTYSYDLAGNISQSTDNRGISTEFEYDAANNLTYISYPNAAENVSFVYGESENNQNNSVGKIASVITDAYQYDYSYNDQGSITRIDLTYSSGISSDLAFAYDDGYLSEITYPSGAKVRYHYSHGQISAVDLVTQNDDLTESTQSLGSNISYLPFGPISAMTFGNGKHTALSYDSHYRLTDKQVDGVISHTFEYDDLQNIESITDQTDNANSQNFEYDLLDRLTDATGTYGEINYEYDAIGNRLSKTDDENGTDLYTYDANHLVQTTNSIFEYDENGNLIQKGSNTFTYNDANRLETAYVDGTTYTYQYNHLGQRISKSNGVDTRYFTYGPDGLLLAETDSQGKVIFEYVYLNGQRIAIFAENENTTDLPATDAADTFYLVNDATGMKLSARGTSEASLMEVVSANDANAYAEFSKVPFNTSYFYLENEETGFYFRPKANSNNASIEQRPTNYRGTRTRWRIIGSGTQGIDLQNWWTKKYLSVSGNAENSNAVITSNIDDSLASWSFVPVNQATDNVDIYYIHTSHLDAPLALTDEAGNIAWEASYTPFGKIDVVTNNLPESFKLRFPGQYEDEETGFYYNYFRDYDPEIGRYIQSDPIGLEGGLNTYAYVGGNPISFVDPNGLARCTYSISTSSLVCTSNTANDPNFVGPHEIRELNPKNVHSGRGEHRNNPGSADVKNYGPIWPGVFNMTPNELPGREGWWALQEPGWTKLDSLLYRLGLKRAGANLHMGTISHGCITVDLAESDQFNKLINLLRKEAGDNVLTVVP